MGSRISEDINKFTKVVIQIQYGRKSVTKTRITTLAARGKNLDLLVVMSP